MASRISVCLPTFNGERFLAGALDCILAQSVPDFELIIVDDNSTDGTRHLIESYAARDSRIKPYFNDCSVGLFANYNLCISKAKGEFVKLFAQDDLLHPEALAESVKILDAYPEVSVVSLQRVLIDDLGQCIDATFAYRDRLPKEIPIGAHELAAQCLFPITNCIGEPSTVMFRRRDQGTGFNVDLLQIGDIEYWIRLAMAGSLYLVDKPYCYFRQHDDSRTASNTSSMACASDVITIARKYSWLFDVCARTEEEFIGSNLADLSKHTALSIKRGTLDQYRVRLSGELHKQSLVRATSKEEIEFLHEQVESFRELAFHCLRYMSDTVSHTVSIQQSETRHTNVKKIDGLETELRTLLDSYSWRMTKPLRDIKRMVLLGQAENVLAEGFEEGNGLDATYQQELYIFHLRNMIAKVKSSQSWRITEPLRFREQSAK